MYKKIKTHQVKYDRNELGFLMIINNPVTNPGNKNDSGRSILADILSFRYPKGNTDITFTISVTIASLAFKSY